MAHLQCICLYSEIQRFIVRPRIDMFQGCKHITALTGGIKYENYKNAQNDNSSSKQDNFEAISACQHAKLLHIDELEN